MVFCSPTLEWAEGPPRGTFLSLTLMRAASDLLVINICAFERKYDRSSFFASVPEIPFWSTTFFGRALFLHLSFPVRELSVMQQRLFAPHFAMPKFVSHQVLFSCSFLFAARASSKSFSQWQETIKRQRSLELSPSGNKVGDNLRI